MYCIHHGISSNVRLDMIWCEKKVYRHTHPNRCIKWLHPTPTSARKVSTIRALNWSSNGFPSMQQQQQHKLYLHDYNYVITVLQKL